MSEDKHTPGPWRYSKCPCGDRLCDQHIISVQRSGGFNEPDARLMVAAPDLLDVLKAVQQQCLFDDDDGQIGVSEDVVIPADLFDRICSAINKAEGQS